MEKPSPKPTLDEIVFEGRNKDYGAYFLRKGYPRDLLYSLSISVGFCIVMLFLFIEATKLGLNDSYLFPQQEGQSVNVELADKPFGLKTYRPVGKASTTFTVPKIVATLSEEKTDAAKTDKVSNGSQDSTVKDNSGADIKDEGASSNKGNGIVGEIYGSVDVNPQFPGGIKAMQEFIKDSLQYPETARRLNIRGTILVYVVVASDGSLRDVKVVKGLQSDLDNEAVRMVNSMPRWKAASRGGVPVNVRCTLPISVSPLK